MTSSRTGYDENENEDGEAGEDGDGGCDDVKEVRTIANDGIVDDCHNDGVMTMQEMTRLKEGLTRANWLPSHVSLAKAPAPLKPYLCIPIAIDLHLQELSGKLISR